MLFIEDIEYEPAEIGVNEENSNPEVNEILSDEIVESIHNDAYVAEDEEVNFVEKNLDTMVFGDPRKFHCSRSYHQEELWWAKVPIDCDVQTFKEVETIVSGHFQSNIHYYVRDSYQNKYSVCLFVSLQQTNTQCVRSTTNSQVRAEAAWSTTCCNGVLCNKALPGVLQAHVYHPIYHG
ncbi:hypothetical protein OUZ56_032040 [Daphnia magna]|uniref:Uncharacterized protein n=1 Tax=Daphnia magna TaxID=35525 RepID=A0ABQ9ZVY2_9CRUS|nr:hypothetical protein OUZ56_032040 [Daphnia magna]